MFKTLIYAGKTYEGFVINEEGDIKNLKTNHIYKKIIAPSGYYVVFLSLGKRNKNKDIRVHKAVAETFIPNPNNYPVVHHKDDNKLNPHVSNLEWTTQKKNVQYHLEKASQETEFYNNRKLTEEDVKHIRELNGILSRRKIAIMFNVSKTTITNVCNNRFYKKEGEKL